MPADLRVVTQVGVVDDRSAGLSADMALRLSKWFGTSPEMWLGLQTQYDLWQAESRDQPVIEPLRKAA